MTNPLIPRDPNYIPNLPAPEREFPEQIGDISQLNASDGSAPKAPQPATEQNPSGTAGSIPVMSIDAEAAAALAGPQG